MAKAYPNSRFTGFDYHPASIEQARKRAEAAGVADRVTFEVAPAKSFPGSNYDFIAFFDCLHDMGDPAGAARHVRQALAPEGTWMIVEPFASDDLTANFNPVGRIYYSASAGNLCARFPFSGSRARLGRTSGRGQASRSGPRGRIHAIPAGQRDSVQHGVRGATLTLYNRGQAPLAKPAKIARIPLRTLRLCETIICRPEFRGPTLPTHRLYGARGAVHTPAPGIIVL
jgi:SAM-dependent methyltransferase